MSNFIRNIKGTKDILPLDSRLWLETESIIHNFMSLHGYDLIRTPVFEKTELFNRSIGENTDIVNKEMYTWIDRDGTSLTLSPESTASVVRSYIQNQLGNLSPIQRLYYIDSSFRRERPQKGRQRQFTQYGVEAIGSNHPEQDAEVILIAFRIYQMLGIDDLEVNINSIGSQESRAKYIDALKNNGVVPKNNHNLSDLRTICSTGSPLSEDGFRYVYDKIKKDIHLSSISGGTDIVSCFVLGNLFQPVYSGEIQNRGLGMDVDIFDEKGLSIHNTKGELVCKKPFPSMPIKFWNDEGDKKYKAAYFKKYKNIWHHGDFAKITKNGGFIIFGRSDTTLNPGGVRLGTAEIYNVVEKFKEIKESIVIGQSWKNDIRVILFVVLNKGYNLTDEIKNKIKKTIKAEASPRHVPAKIIAILDIPKTKNGKLVELAVKQSIEGEAIKNLEALANPDSLKQFKKIKELNE